MPNTTDYYQICEDALADCLRTLTTHFPHSWQVSDDDTVLGQGADNFIIYRPGAMPVTPISTAETIVVDITWQIIGRLHTKYTSYKDAWTIFKAVRKGIINVILPNYSLVTPDNPAGTTGVWRVNLTSGEGAQYFFFDEPKPGVRPNFIIQDMVYSITQRCTFEPTEKI